MPEHVEKAVTACLILLNVVNRRGPSKIMKVETDRIQVLPCDASLEYLGQLADIDMTAMEYRLKNGWAALDFRYLLPQPLSWGSYCQVLRTDKVCMTRLRSSSTS